MSRRRLQSCVEEWPECETGKYDPHCCRFPKSCSCTVYDEEDVAEVDLEPRTDTPRSQPYLREMFAAFDTPTKEELQQLLDAGDSLSTAIVELWRGRSIVSSVTAARLTREQADALLVALREMPSDA